jgi:voltage-gated potassium channel Kch
VAYPRDWTARVGSRRGHSGESSHQIAISSLEGGRSARCYRATVPAALRNFTVETLTRTDSLYFTVTIFATVGFGDISPASEAARILVMAQMILDLIVLGLGIRIFVGAIEVGRQKTSNGPQTPDGR